MKQLSDARKKEHIKIINTWWLKCSTWSKRAKISGKTSNSKDREKMAIEIQNRYAKEFREKEIQIKFQYDKKLGRRLLRKFDTKEKETYIKALDNNRSDDYSYVTDNLPHLMIKLK